MIRRRTLSGHLLAWAFGALAVVWIGFIAAGFRAGTHEAEELTDGVLASTASLLLSERSNEFVAPRNTAEAAQKSLNDLKSHDYQQSMSIVVWNAAGEATSRTGDAPTPAFESAEGFATLQLGAPATAWRVFTRWNGPQRSRRVMVLLSIEERDALALDIGAQVAAPGVLLLPVVALALGLAVHRGLRPLRKLSHDVHALDTQRMSRLQTEQRQEEFQAVVDAINTLTARYQGALSRERDLASEFAHELRTPLASVTLHANSLRGALSAAERGRTLDLLERDALRAGQVIADLLALARASRTDLAEKSVPIDLAELAGRVMAEYGQLALDSGHELGLAGSGNFPMLGHPVLLEMALRNLIENALAHTPRGTTVELQFDAAARWLQVCDDGAAPGRPAAPQAPAMGGLQAAGLGLGHRVVQKVAAIHDGCFEQVPAPVGFSTAYRIDFAASGRANYKPAGGASVIRP